MIARFLLIIALLNFHALSSQTKLSLKNAKTILFENNLNIKQSELQEKMARLDLDQSYSDLLPNISLGVNNQNTLGLNFDQITGQLITGNQWGTFINANISSELILFQGLRRINTIRARKVNMDITKLETEKIKFEFELLLIQLYYGALINYDLYKTSLEQHKLSKQLLQAEEIKIAVGKNTLVDIALAKNKVATDDLNCRNAKNAYKLSLLKLKQLLELDLNEEITLVKPTYSDPLRVFPFKVYDFRRDPYINILERNVELSRLELRNAKADFYPTIVINNGYGTNFSSRRYTDPFSNSVMPLFEQFNINRSLFINLSVSYNVFNRFATKTNIKKSKLGIQNLEIERSKSIRERKLLFEEAKLEFEGAIEENKATLVTHETSKLSYEAMLERHKVGKSTSIELFKTVTDYNVAEFQIIISQYTVLLKRELLLAMIRLSEE